MPQGEVAGRDAMREYAGRIDAAYRFDKDSRYFDGLPVAYGRFRPVHDQDFQQYDAVLYADTDVWPVDGIKESPFEGFAADIGICTEPLQPVMRKESSGPICTANDERWAKAVRLTWGAEMPRHEGLLKVFNAGVQMWSRRGREKALREFIPFREYVRAMRGLPAFYASDQHYIHAMMFVAGLDVVELNNDWNRFVHYLTSGRNIVGVSDQRTASCKFVHVQLRGAGDYDRETLWGIVNRPQDQWRLH